MTKQELIQEIQSYKGEHKGLATKKKAELQAVLEQLQVEVLEKECNQLWQTTVGK